MEELPEDIPATERGLISQRRAEEANETTEIKKGFAEDEEKGDETVVRDLDGEETDEEEDESSDSESDDSEESEEQEEASEKDDEFVYDYYESLGEPSWLTRSLAMSPCVSMLLGFVIMGSLTVFVALKAPIRQLSPFDDFLLPNSDSWIAMNQLLGATKFFNWDNYINKKNTPAFQTMKKR